MAQDIAAKPYKALGSDLARSAKAARQRAEDAFLRLSLPIQEMAAAGRDVGLEVRRKVERLRADQTVRHHGEALGAALRRTDAAIRQTERAIEFSNESRTLRDLARKVAGAGRVQATPAQQGVVRGADGIAAGIRSNEAAIRQTERAIEFSEDSRRIRGMMAAVSGPALVQATPGQKALVRGANGIAAGIRSNEAALRQTKRVIEMSEGLNKLRITMAQLARGRPVQAGTARRDLAGAGGDLAAAVRRNDVELQKLEGAIEASRANRAKQASQESQGSQVSQAAKPVPGGNMSKDQADAVRRSLTRELIGMDEALRQNQQAKSGGANPDAGHLRGMRFDTDEARRKLADILSLPSPSPKLK